MWLVGGGILVIICAVVGVFRTYHDSCTGSTERSPQAVIESYTEAVHQGDLSRVKNCWHHDPYYETDTGCSELCLSKIMGNQFEITNIEFGEEYRSGDGRTNMNVSVSISCSQSNEDHEAEITLDTTGQNYPWRHWHIIYSTFGGSVAQLWCK